MIGYKQPKDPHKNYSSKNSSDEYMVEYKSLSNEEQMKTIMNPGHVDEDKWEKAKEASMKEYGEHKWPVVMFIYEKMGGK